MTRLSMAGRLTLAGVLMLCLAATVVVAAAFYMQGPSLPASGARPAGWVTVSPANPGDGATAVPPPVVVVPQPSTQSTPALGPTAPPAATPAPDPALVARVDALIAKMTVADKVGQLLIYGIPGTNAAASAAIIQQDRLGSVILVGHNVNSAAQLAELSRGLQQQAQAVSGVPMFIAIDQEGGEVIRLRTGASVFPSQMAIGASYNADLARRVGQVSGAELRAAGVNMVLGPVLDVNDNPDNPVIGLRSYGERPELVSALGEAYLQGVQSQGLVAVAKHFPGHGSTGVDSHVALPVVNQSRAEIDARNFPPFKKVVKRGAGGVMLGHLLFPALDPNLPATVSPAIIDGLLRRELGYDGLIMTDDLEMAGITGQYGTAGAAVRALKAGADLMMVAWTRDRQVATRQALIQGVQSGEISEARLNESVRRVLAAKLRWQAAAPEGDPATVGSPANLAVALEASRAAITAVKGRENLGVQVAGKRVLVLSPVNLPASGNGSQLAAELRQRNAQVTDLTYDFDSETSKAGALSRTPAMAASADLIVIGTWDAGPWQTQLVNLALQSGKPVYALGFGMPYELALFPNVATYLAAYGRTPNQISAAIAALAGEYAPSGKLPVSVAGVATAAPFGG